LAAEITKHVGEIRRYYAREKGHLYYFNDAQISAYQSTAKKRFTEERQAARLQFEMTREEQLRAQNGGRSKVAPVKADSLPPDQFEREIDTLARVEAYYRAVKDRFVPGVCQLIDAELFAGCKKNIVDHLFTSLGIRYDNENNEAVLKRCFRLVAEDGSVEERREDLKQRILKLEEAKKAITSSRGLSVSRF
jgi:hypothetical protein